MLRKAAFVAGLATGYVLGARAGRERYDQIMQMLGRVREEPLVQQTTEAVKSQATQLAADGRDAARDTVASALHRDDAPTGSAPYPGPGAGGPNL